MWAQGVAGVYAPAFVERRRAVPWISCSTLPVSPEFMLRPSLSEVPDPALGLLFAGVAGVYAPAFVERGPTGRRSIRI